MKVIIGAGNTVQDGWLSLREQDLDITQRWQWANLFHPDSIEAILAEHVWEHLSFQEAEAAARNCFEFLMPGGSLRIAVPDGFHPDSQYIHWVRPGTGWNGDDHKILFNYISLCALLSHVGFVCQPKEFFDESARFYSEPVDSQRGEIRRSAHRFNHCLEGVVVTAILGVTYTSLIVDATKPAGVRLWN